MVSMWNGPDGRFSHSGRTDWLSWQKPDTGLNARGHWPLPCIPPRIRLQFSLPGNTTMVLLILLLLPDTLEYKSTFGCSTGPSERGSVKGTCSDGESAPYLPFWSAFGLVFSPLHDFARSRNKDIWCEILQGVTYQSVRWTYLNATHCYMHIIAYSYCSVLLFQKYGSFVLVFRNGTARVLHRFQQSLALFPETLPFLHG